MTQYEKDTLEAILDCNSPSSVLSALAEICAEKAEHIRVNWQDFGTAGLWNRRGLRIAKVAEVLKSQNC